MARAVVYLRVSTAEQAGSGAGLRAQEDACRVHAGRAGLEVLGPFADEGVSGAAPLDEREGLAEALAAVGPGDVLLVAKRDRLGREPILVAMIESAVAKQGGRVASSAGEGCDDDSPSSILLRRVTDAIAEHERLVLKVRTKAALAAKRRRGERTGGVPIGFSLVDDGRRSKQGRPLALVPDPAEQATVALVHRLHRDGLGDRAIAAELDRRGIPTKKGGPRWAPGSVARILQRAGLAGRGPDHVDPE